MSLYSKYLHSFLLNLFTLLNQNQLEISVFSGNLCIFLYFAHVLNYIIKPLYSSSSFKIQGFFLFFFYSDPSNLVLFLSNNAIFLLIFVIFSLGVYCPLFILMVSLLSPQKNIHNLLIKFLAYYLLLYNWIYFIPINNMLLLVFNNTSNLGLLTTNSYILSIFAVLGISFNVLLAIFGLFSFGSLEFLDNQSLRHGFSGFISFLMFLLRLLLSILSPFNQAFPLIFYIILQMFFGLIFYASFYDFPLRNLRNCRFFISMLLVSEIILISTFFYEFVGLFNARHLFFIAVFMSILAFKLGNNLFEKKYRKIVFLNSSDSIYFLEELYDLSQQNNKLKEKHFILLGNSYINLNKNSKNEIKFNAFSDSELIPLNNEFILGKFKKLLHLSMKNPEKRQVLLIKFMSFLLKANLNPITSYLEVQKAGFSLKTSLFLDIYREIFQKALKTRIKGLKYLKNNELSVDFFYKLSKKLRFYDKDLKDLLKEKRLFWEFYQIGIPNNSDLIEKTVILAKRILDFIEILNSFKNSSFQSLYLIHLKYLSIVNSILLNSVDRALRLEDEFDNLMKRNLDLKSKNLNNLSFLDKNTVIAMISCLNIGKIKEKSEKLANFFGYSFNEFHSINNINILMPEFIANKHDSFIENMFKRPKDSMELSNRTIDTFAVNKKGFIFRIHVFYGFNFDYSEDFMLIGAILKQNIEESYELLFEEKGFIVGFSEKIYVFLKELNPFLQKEDIKRLNVWWMVSFFEGNHENKEKINNFMGINGELRVPANLKELADRIKEIKGDNSEKSEFFKANCKNLKRFYIIFDFSSQKLSSNSYLILNYLNIRKIRPEIEEEALIDISNLGMNPDFSRKSSYFLNDVDNPINVATSHKASSLGESQAERFIFSLIAKIQKHRLPIAFHLCITLLFEILMIVGYFSVLWVYYQGYVNNYYDPIQHSLIDYCNLATSLSYSTAMFTEMEYQSYNLTNRTLDSLKQGLWIRIMQENYEFMKDINFHERNIEGGLNYQKIYQNVENKYIDPESLKILILEYSDNLDIWDRLIYETLLNFNRSLTKNEQITLQRNYPYILPSTSTIYLAVKSDFNNSNLGTTQTILDLLLAFMIINGLIKLFQMILLLSYYQKISQIIMIFRRVGQQDAFNESKFIQEVLNSCSEPYLKNKFSDKVLNKKVEMVERVSSIQNSSTSTKRKSIARKHKRSSFYNVRQLPKTKVIFFMFGVLLLSFVYYFFNYFFWINNNVSINNLIQINCFFIDVYIYSTSIIAFNAMALRERVTRNFDYENIDDIYQNHQTRLSYFYSGLMKRIYIIGNTTAFDLPMYTIQAQNNK